MRHKWVFGLAVLLIAGCNQSNSPAPATPSPTAPAPAPAPVSQVPSRIEGGFGLKLGEPIPPTFDFKLDTNQDGSVSARFELEEGKIWRWIEASLTSDGRISSILAMAPGLDDGWQTAREIRLGLEARYGKSEKTETGFEFKSGQRSLKVNQIRDSVSALYMDHELLPHVIEKTNTYGL